MLTAGCSSLDAVYVREGIGTELSSPGLPAVSLLQDIYMGEICRQAGLPTIARPLPNREVLVCDEAVMRPVEWALFVQAGMNDIDRRCDAYLAWLDNKRRWREPILKQINITAATTAAILGLTGVGATPIAIVGTAFGFAADTFVNFHSRLITEIDNAVVQTVVLGHQNDFRIQLAKIPIIDNRPAAIYLLRSYLRICTPFSIEMSVSNTVTVFHRAGPEALVRDAPMLTRAPEVARVSAVITNPRAALVVQPKRREPGPTRFGGFEESLSRDNILRYQIAICVAPTGDLGPRGSPTRRAISAYFVARGETADEIINRVNVAFLDEAAEKVDAIKGETCAKKGFANARAVGDSFRR